MPFGVKQKRCGFFLLLFFLILGSSSSLFAEATTYPRIDLMGYKKYEFRDVQVAPKENYFLAISQLGGYTPNITGGPWQEALQLKIVGELNEHLTATYDLEQQPDMPEKYDVKVKYDKHELTFGDFQADVSGNQFASANKTVNGMMITSKDNWYDFTFVPSAKDRSQSQKLTTQKGNNTTGPYSLGHGSIVEGSENVELNGIRLTRGKDYDIDYFSGKITFRQILTPQDEFKYSFEYTNLIDLFFPSLSKKEFFALQGRVNIDPAEFRRKVPEPEYVVKNFSEIYPQVFSSQEARSSLEATTSLESTASLEVLSSPEAVPGFGEPLRYQLKHFPLKAFSEEITYSGNKLKKDEDYKITYADGKIALLSQYLPDAKNQLIINYVYHITSRETDSFSGVLGAGPYNLDYQKVVAKSEKVFLNEKLVMRGLDYKIDYENGQINFYTTIGPSSVVRVEYDYPIKDILDTYKASSNRFILGTTYLKESAKKSTGGPTSSASEQLAGAQTIYLANPPINATSEVTVTLNGLPLTYEADYIFPTTEAGTGGTAIVRPATKLAFINDRTDLSDGLDTGTIKMLRTVSSSDVIAVSYTFKRSIAGQTQPAPGNNTRGPYYFPTQYRNIVPGSEIVQVWLKDSNVITNYTRNGSFDADAGATGYSINYTENSPSITFNDNLPDTKRYKVLFRYVPDRSGQNEDLTHSVLGIDAKAKLKDVFYIEGQMAQSETSQVRLSANTIEAFKGNNTRNYTLNSPGTIFDATERVYVNNRLLNRETDYFMSYDQPGRLTFYYITPATQDAITIEYEYQSTAAVVTSTGMRKGGAYEMGVGGKFSDAFKYDIKAREVEANFSPIATTAMSAGSRRTDWKFDFIPNQVVSFGRSHRETIEQIGSSPGRNTNSQDDIYNLGFKKGKVNSAFSFRQYDTYQDKDSTGQYPGDSNLESWNGNIGLNALKRGEIEYSNLFEGRRTTNINDVRDSLQLSRSIDNFFRMKHDFKATKNVGLIIDYQVSNPYTTISSFDGTSTREVESTYIFRDNTYDFSLNVPFTKIKKLFARTRWINHEGLLISGLKNRDNEKSTNALYHLDFIPRDEIIYNYDHTRQESVTVVNGAQNPKAENSNSNLRLIPRKNITLDWKWAGNSNVQETGRMSSGNSNSYNVGWTLLDISKLKTTLNYEAGISLMNAPSGTWEVLTNTDSSKVSAGIKFSPFSKINIEPLFSMENYINTNNDPVSPVKTYAQVQNTDLKVNIYPISVLDLGYIYSNRFTRDLANTLGGRNRILTTVRASYKVFSWGTLDYEIQEEDNNGEVRGGQLLDLDLLKTTNALSLNIVIPQDNVVLSSIVFKATLKNVKYANYKSAADDFNAQLLTFEGTLNF